MTQLKDRIVYLADGREATVVEYALVARPNGTLTTGAIILIEDNYLVPVEFKSIRLKKPEKTND